MNAYDLSRGFIDYSFENPTNIKPNHYALYFFAIEHCNRLGWKREFGLPTTMTMEATGIRSYNTYKKTFDELERFGFFIVKERSKNQYSSNIIELSKFDKALNKALDKALIKHTTKQSDKKITKQSESNKQADSNTGVPIKNYREFAHLKISFEDFEKLNAEYSKNLIDEVLDKIENYKKNTQYRSLFLTAKNWLKKEKSFAKEENITEKPIAGRMTESVMMSNFNAFMNVKIPGLEDG